MLRFQTKRLIIRSFCSSDLKSLCNLLSCEEVARYEDFFPMTKKEVQSLLAQWRKENDHFAVVIKETMEFIGEVGFWKDENGNYSITFDFLPSYTNRGYATEAVSKLVDYLFRALKVKDLFADCDTRNVAACHLLKRVGFTLVDSLKKQTYKEGTIGDINLYRKRNDLFNS